MGEKVYKQSNNCYNMDNEFMSRNIKYIFDKKKCCFWIVISFWVIYM